VKNPFEFLSRGWFSFYLLWRNSIKSRMFLKVLIAVERIIKTENSLLMAKL